MVDPHHVIWGVKRHDSSVTLGISALQYQMAVTIRKVGICSNFRIMVGTEIVSQLMSKAEVPESAGLCDD